MGITIGLDLSTKPGFAIFKGETLERFGTLWAEKTREDFGPYPMNYLLLADHVAVRIINEVIDRELLNRSDVPTIVIEETTGSNQNYTQKILEFIHCRLLHHLHFRSPYNIIYIRDGVWKKLVGANQNKEEKRLQAKISRQKKKKKAEFLKENPNAEKIPNFRAKLDLDGTGKAKVVAKLDQADYSIRAFNEHFGMKLTKEHEDAAEAALMVKAYFMGAAPCDGTVDGGLHEKRTSSPAGEKSDQGQHEGTPGDDTSPSNVE